MKRILFSLLLTLVTGQMMAQVRLPERPNRPQYVDHSELDNGFWCAIEGKVGSSIQFNANNAQRAGLTFTGGYMVNEYLKIGFGVGANYYFNHNDRLRDTNILWNVPIYFDIRGNLLSQEIRDFVPYWSIDIGAMIRDGFFFSPTFGFRFGEKRNSWLLGLNFTVQRINNIPTEPETICFLGIIVGYEF